MSNSTTTTATTTGISNNNSSTSTPSAATVASTTSTTTTTSSAPTKTDEIVLGPTGGFGFFASFGAGAGGGGSKGSSIFSSLSSNPSTSSSSSKDGSGGNDDGISLRPQTNFMKKPYTEGGSSYSSEGGKGSQKHGNNVGGKNKPFHEKDANGKSKKKYVYTAAYLRKFQSAGFTPPDEMAWYLSEVKPAAGGPAGPAQPTPVPTKQPPQWKGEGKRPDQRHSHQHQHPHQYQQPPQHQQPQQPEEPALPHRQSANPWLPRYQSIFGTSDPQQQYRSKVLSNVKGVLNKLTLEHFDSLSAALVKQLKDANGSDLKAEIIQQVFDKAISEPNFSNMYANLCYKLYEKCPKWKATNPSSPDQQEETFRNVLLGLCQKQFDKSVSGRDRQKLEGREESKEGDKVDEERELEREEKRRQREEAQLSDQKEEDSEDLGPKEGMDEDWEELRLAKIKKRNLGNVRFVGELFKKKLLGMNVIHECIQLILKKPMPHEEDIEILCSLLNTVGKDIDIPKAETYINIYFKKMGKMAQNKQYPARIRFMLMDTIELRTNKWVPRKEQNAPQKIADIHAKAYEEDLKNAAIGREFQLTQQTMPQASTPSRPAVSTSTSSAPTSKGTPISGSTGGKKKEKATTASPKTKESQPKEDLVALETEADSIIEEYLNSADTKEAAACLRQLSSPSAPYIFVMRAANFYAEKKERDRQAIVSLIDGLVKENAISSDDVTKGFSKTFGGLEDLEIDVPNASEKVGELIGKGLKSKWLSATSINKEIEKLPAKIKSKLQNGIGPDVRLG